MRQILFWAFREMFLETHNLGILKSKHDSIETHNVSGAQCGAATDTIYFFK